MAILVLGGAGYIGSHTVHELIEAGRDVVVADNLLTGFRAAVHPKARFYQADIRDRAAMDKLFQTEHIDGVIHFAASSQVGESMTDPLKYYDNNLCGIRICSFLRMRAIWLGPLPAAHMAKILRTMDAASSSTINFFVSGSFR